jgi:PAS domain S-box-containing protein
VNAAACELFGYSESEMLQMPGFKFIDIHDPSFVEFKQNMGKTFHTELVGIRSDGTRFPVDANVSTHRQSNGHTFTWAVIRDISEQKQYQQMQIEQEKLRTALEKEAELSQLKSRIMERIAHEFRTPLTVLQMTTESLTTYLDRFTPEQRNARASSIKKQNHRLTEMLDEIAIAMRGSFLPEKLVFSPVDLSALCRDVIHALEAQFDLAGKYMLDAPEQVCIMADRGALWNTVYHVLTNAYRYSPRTEPVHIHLIERESWIDLTVASKSIGVPDGETEKIFEPFVRGSNIGEITGLGLGLTIAKAAVEAHHGTITIESSPDQATTVRITLPINIGEVD